MNLANMQKTVTFRFGNKKVTANDVRMEKRNEIVSLFSFSFIFLSSDGEFKDCHRYQVFMCPASCRKALFFSLRANLQKEIYHFCDERKINLQRERKRC